MRKLYLLLFALICLFFLFGCQQAKNIEKMTIYSMENNSVIIVIEDQETIKKVQEAIAIAKQEPGIVNMVDPEYRIELGEKTYYLWVSENSGTIMDVEETHTIFTLSENAVELLNEVLKSSN